MIRYFFTGNCVIEFAIFSGEYFKLTISVYTGETQKFRAVCRVIPLLIINKKHSKTQLLMRI